MKTHTTAIALALSLALVGQANAGVRDLFQPRQPAAQVGATDLPTVEVNGQAPQVDKAQAAKAGVQGCAIGGMLGGLLGVDASVGCAVGGIAGFGFSYRKQLKDARAVEAAARAAGMDAVVTTEQAVNAKGKTEERVKSLVIPYEAADMVAMDAATSTVIDRLAAMTSKAKNTLTIRFEGSTAACHIPLGELSKRGALEGHTVDNQCGLAGASHAIVITPVPDVR